MSNIFRRHCDTLENGLRVVTLETPHLHSALAAVHVRAGSRHETPRTNGVTHFLEHVLFRGSENFPDSLAASALVEDAGGSLNGMTLRDQCAFDTPIHPTRLELALRVLGDMVSRPLFLGVELEREIILEEMMDEVDSEGRDIDAGNRMMKLIYGGHPLGMKVAGTTDTVKALTEGDLKDHHARRFNGSSAVVTVAGPVHREEVVPLAAECFSGLPKGQLPEESAPVLLPMGPRLDLLDLDESQTDLCISFPCPPETHPDHPALAMIRAILDDSLTSRLQREIVETRGLAYSIRAGMELFCDAGTFDIDASCTPAKVLALTDAVLSLLGSLASVPVPQEELDRVLARRRIALDFHADDLTTLLNCLGAMELFRPPETFEDSLAALGRVTPTQLLDAARRTFTQDQLHLCAVGPKAGRLKKQLFACAKKHLPARSAP